MVGFNDRSIGRMAGVDPRLLEILNRARTISGVDFEISEGMRDATRQAELVASGASQTQNSRHLTGNATDIFIPDGKGGVNWDFEAYRPIADAAKVAAKELGYDDFQWGGDWESLRDGVHFQVGRSGNAPATQSILTSKSSKNTESQPMIAEQPQARGLLDALGIQKRDVNAGGETALPFYQRDTFKDTAASLAQGFAAMGSMPALQKMTADISSQRTEQKARNKTVAYLRANGRDDLADMVEKGLIGGKEAAALMLSKPKDDRTAAMHNFAEYNRIAADLGQDAADRFLAMTRNGSVTNVNTGDVNGGKYLYGTKAGLPPGYRLDIETNEASVIPGGPADTAAADAAAKDAGFNTQATAGSIVLGDIAEMKRRVEESPILTTGFIGGMLKDYGGTGALDVNELGKTIRANIGFDRLQRMRDESPTGGALGQVAIQELEALQASLGSLNTSQGSGQLIRNLERLETQYKKSMRRILETEGGAQYFTQSEADFILATPQGSSGQPTVINNYTIQKVD